MTRTRLVAVLVVALGVAGIALGQGYIPGAGSGGGAGMTSLTGDVTATGPGASAAAVALVGGSSASNVHAAELTCNAATNANTVSTIVKRDSSGNFVGTTYFGNVVSPAGANVQGMSLGDGGMFCYNADCTNYEETDGGIATVNSVSGIFRTARVLDNSASNAAFRTMGANPAGTGIVTAAIEDWYSTTGLAFQIFPGGVVKGWTQMIGNSGAFIQADQYGGRTSSATVALLGSKSDSASSVALALGNASAFTTAGDQLVSVRNGSAASSEIGYILPTGVSSLYTQHPVTGGGKRTGEYTITLNSDSTFTATRLPSPTIRTAGSVASAPTADGTLNMIDYPTTASSGNASGINGPYTVTRFDFRPRLTAVVRTGASIANTNIYVGMCEADVSGATTVTDFAAHSCVVAAYIPSDPRLNWTLITSNGVAKTDGASAVAVAANTTYVIDLDFSRSGGAIMRINNAATGGSGYVLNTTTLPSGATDIGINISATTTTTAAKDFYVGKAALEQN
jgi:hypothetical protein